VQGEPRVKESAFCIAVPFTKMSGSGNDFILIDNRGGRVRQEASADFVTAVCRRKLSIGADGVIFIENARKADFRWRFYNSDGSLAEMCGNGARCAARFAWLKGIAGRRSRFETLAGTISAQVVGDRVRVKLTDPTDIAKDVAVDTGQERFVVDSLNTGVPHVVVAVGDIESVDVVSLGRAIRNHERFAPAGTNVNFVSIRPDGRMDIRTYERGVENETLACGTGAVAAALSAHLRGAARPPVTLVPRGGAELTVFFEPYENGFRNVLLEGDARVVYEGLITPEAAAY